MNLYSCWLGVKFNIAPGVNLDFGYQVNFFILTTLDGTIMAQITTGFLMPHAV